MQPEPVAALQLTLAECVATDAVLPRTLGGGGHLLAYVGGRQLAVAAVERRLLLLAAAPDAVKPVRCLLECSASITAVAASSANTRPGPAGSAGSAAAVCWAAALAGGEAHFVPLEADCGLPACVAKAPSSRWAGKDDGAAWAACAWHPAQPVCALLAPEEIQLLHMPSGPDGGCDLLATAATPGSVPRHSSAPRCAAAWMRPPGRAGAPCGQLAVCWGEQELEVLSFGEGWQLHERRQLLPAVEGPIQGLAAVRSGGLLVATERPLREWVQDSCGDTQRLAAEAVQRGLQAVKARTDQPLRVPAASGEAAEAHAGTAASLLPNEQDGSTAEASGELLECPDGILRPAAAPADAAAPKVPPVFVLPSAVPSERLPSAPLDAAGGTNGGACVQLRARGPALGRATLLGLPGGPQGGSIGVDLAPEFVAETGGMAVLAGSSSRPALALCSLQGASLARHGGAATLPLPAGIPDGSRVRIRGLAAAAEAGQVRMWVMLAASPPAAGAPFLGASLTCHGGRATTPAQVWLCCYSLPPGELAGFDDEGPSACPQPGPADGGAPPFVHAVSALRQGVAELRRDMNARLDALEAQLAGLLQHGPNEARRGDTH